LKTGVDNKKKVFKQNFGQVGNVLTQIVGLGPQVKVSQGTAHTDSQNALQIEVLEKQLKDA
jgi:hypothetical protein